MPRKVLRNCLLLDPESGRPESAALLLERDRIAARLPAQGPWPEDAIQQDLSGLLVAPGFIDVHFHGELIFTPPEQLHDALMRASASLVRHGTTAFLATTVAWPAATLGAFLTQAESSLSSRSWPGAQPIGVHLEGPWINSEAAGAQPASGIRPFHLTEDARIIEQWGGILKMVTLAPECGGGSELLELLVRRGVVAALGHSHASPSRIDAAVGDGMTHVTHLFNAMGSMHHRSPGVSGSVLADRHLTCDLICDGVHVDPRMVVLASRALGERLILATDRIEPTGSAPKMGGEAVSDDGTAIRLADGRLAGSSLTMDRAVRNASRFGAMGQLDAVAAATLRPARLLGIEAERGTLRVGARADFAMLDPAGNVAQSWVAGARIA